MRLRAFRRITDEIVTAERGTIREPPHGVWEFICLYTIAGKAIPKVEDLGFFCLWKVMKP